VQSDIKNKDKMWWVTTGTNVGKVDIGGKYIKTIKGADLQERLAVSKGGGQGGSKGHVVSNG